MLLLSTMLHPIGTALQILAGDAKMWGLFAWMAMWSILRYTDVVEARPVPANMIRYALQQ
jgi:hypothetical protein